MFDRDDDSEDDLELETDGVNGEAVGYGRPPRDTQFKKGVSGNPKGRPKAKFNAATCLKKVMSAPVKVNVGGRTKTMTGLEAFLWTLRNQMLKGDLKAARLFLIFSNEFGAQMGRGEGNDRLDELQAAILAGPADPVSHSEEN